MQTGLSKHGQQVLAKLQEQSPPEFTTLIYDSRGRLLPHDDDVRVQERLAFANLGLDEQEARKLEKALRDAERGTDG